MTAAAVAAVLLAVMVLAGLAAPPMLARFGRNLLVALAALPLAVTAWAAVLLPGAVAGDDRRSQLQWVPSIGLALDLRMDTLALVFTLVIGGVGTLVLVYSGRYFDVDDPGLGRYARALLAFTAAMVGLVLADNLILLVICWELTGILSYLLIAQHRDREPARRAAGQALIVTTAGGLTLLVGAVLLGVTAGTFRISDIVSAPPTGPAVTVAVVLMIVGGISKSALLPFSFWLPGAMAAPTPASAFLHAATMVKAGIYLFARLAPAFAVLPVWRPLLMTLGGATMLFGALLALRQRDLKLLLAQGTVSQLGLMTLLIGCGTAATVLAAMAVLVAHATFKAALFFVVGIVDTRAGGRDLTTLSGVGRAMPGVAALGLAAAASMAGVPPMIGFVAKETGYAALADAGPAGLAGLVVMVLGAALTAAYSARWCWGAFATKRGVPPSTVLPGSASMTGSVGVLVILGLVLGVIPEILTPALRAHAAALGDVTDHPLALWHGWTLPLGLTALALAVGALMFIAQRAVERRVGVAPAPREPGAAYRAVVAGVEAVATRITRPAQTYSPAATVGPVLAVLIVFPGIMLLLAGARPPTTAGTGPAQIVLSLIIIAIAAATVRARRPVPAVLMVGGVGYAVAILFLLRGAPDLALTQLLVESVTLLAALLVLTRLPATLPPRSGGPSRLLRLILAVGVGALMAAVALVLPGSMVAPPVSAGLAAPAVEQGGGHNIVNVILVDVRGWDTFGEISVLIAAATGVASLIFLTGRAPTRRRRSTRPSHAGSPWLAAGVPAQPSLLLEVVTRLVFHIIVLFSLYVLFSGHDQPGGGFAAGLIVGLALALRYLAGGAAELVAAARVDPGVLMGVGLLLAAGTAITSMLAGDPALQSVILTVDVPLLGHLKFVSSTVFDIGVYFIVIGLVLDVLRSFGSELDRLARPQRHRRVTAGGRRPRERRDAAGSTGGSGR